MRSWSLWLLVSISAAAAAACGHQPAPPRVPVVSAPPALTSASIDAMLRAEWSKANVAPAERASDAAWLRRLHVDLLGVLPSPDVIEKFLADASPDKRAKMVDALLSDPRYVQHWTDYWDDELMGQVRGGQIDRAAFRAWLRGRIGENVGWDKLVYALVTASGLQSPGGPRDPFAQKGEEQGVNGAVNYLLKFENPNDLAGSVSRTFLGVQIQCAQCHDHKTEKWKQDDFRKFAACFTRVKVDNVDKGAKMGINKIQIEDVPKPVPRFTKNPELAPIANSAPTALDGTDLSAQLNVRAALGSWMTNKDNPWFTKAIVNRVWAHFLGRGFTNPVDDMRPGNPPDAPEIWDAIAKDFAEHGYDMRRLMRTIALTEVYALATNPKDGAGESVKLWSRFRVMPMTADELVGALFSATDLDELAAKNTKQDPEEIRQRAVAQAAFVFDVDEESDRQSYEGNITQALVMMNGRATAGGTSALPQTTLLKFIQDGKTDEQIVEELYLRTLSRKPTAEETGRAVQYVADAKIKPPPPRATIPPMPRKGQFGGPDALMRAGANAAKDARTAALEDVFWSLLNSSEFFFNH